MIDIQLLRKDIDAVAARLAQRKFQLDVAGFNALEAERKSIQTRTEELQGQRNSLSKQIGILKGKGEDSTEVMNQVASIADELKASADRLEIIQNKLSDFMLAIPNLPHESVPAGGLDAAADKIIAALKDGGPNAQKRGKKLILDIARRMIDEDVIRLTVEQIAEARASDEGRDGLSAFLNKAEPSWRQK